MAYRHPTPSGALSDPKVRHLLAGVSRSVEPVGRDYDSDDDVEPTTRVMPVLA